MKSDPTNSVKAPGKTWLNLPGLLLAGLVVVAFLPSLSGEFLWDDDSNVVKSGPLRTLDGLRRIWLEPGATQMTTPSPTPPFGSIISSGARIRCPTTWRMFCFIS